MFSALFRPVMNFVLPRIGNLVSYVTPLLSRLGASTIEIVKDMKYGIVEGVASAVGQSVAEGILKIPGKVIEPMSDFMKGATVDVAKTFLKRTREFANPGERNVNKRRQFNQSSYLAIEDAPADYEKT